ncbi:MAG: type I restriction endonuclease subunit R [Thaumarchaeota archaeon]|nr:type I restriction endonuclease subunit R [Nitrososphaerota archaeon]
MNPLDKLDEKNLVELPAEKIFQELGYEALYGPDLHPGTENKERETFHEVLFKKRLKKKLQDLNPGLDSQTYDIAISKIEGLGSPDLSENNRAFHQMILAGVKVPITTKEGKPDMAALKLFDFDNPENNEFLAVRQFWVEQHEKRRADHVVFVNGIPLVILEYKDPTNKSATLQTAYNQLGETDYQRYIPRLFYYNTFLVVSDRTDAKYGTFTSPFERFSEWKESDLEHKKLDGLLQGMFEKQTLLNIIQNFIEFENDGTKTIKKIAQQHQYNAVMTLIQKTKETIKKKDENRIGVVWHTTGSGKSLTMIFYVQMLSQIPELQNPTFVILTDRNDLDEQINDFFEVAGFPYPRAPTALQEASGIMDLREKLAVPSGKIIFTTIQKFQVTEEEREGRVHYPRISDRRNIIILADEAHRSQYKKMARNLQTALPNALRVGFTGTPIDLEDRSTTDVFGEVISSYKIPDAVRDNATVQIVYEGRRVDLHLLNKFIGEDFNEITSDLSEDQSEFLAKKWSDVKKLVEDPDRVQKIAKDVVEHFNARKKQWRGKAMLVATTRKSAAMYKEYIDKIPGHPENIVIISGEKRKQVEGVEKKTEEDILQPHIRDKKEIRQIIIDFKKEETPNQLLIVCDMFLTGFDAPLLHTMYVDKPLRDHNLIQAISRVNRIWKTKPSGLIVDYIGITDDLRKALKAFAEGDIKHAMVPTKEIILLMKKKHTELISFFKTPIDEIKNLEDSEESDMIYDAVSEVLESDDTKKWFFENVAELTKAFAVCSPNPACNEIEYDLKVFQAIRKMVSKRTVNAPEIPEEKDSAIKELVEKSIAADELIRQFTLDPKKEVELDEKFISKIKKIKQKNLRVELAYKLLDDSIKAKFKRNLVARKSFLERIQSALSRYHGRFATDDTTIHDIIEVNKDIQDIKNKEEKLHLTEEEIVFYDAVSEGREYIESDEKLIEVARQLTDYMKNNTTIDWMNQESKKADIRSAIRMILLRSGFSTESFEKLVPIIMTQAENNYR